MDDNNKVYVIVRHVSGRFFTLNRKYQIISQDGDGSKEPPHVDKWEGWMPAAQAKPDWARDLPSKEFTAYWSY